MKSIRDMVAYYNTELERDARYEVVVYLLSHLGELDKLSIELGKLTDADAVAETEGIVEEIRTLAEETKYYK